jgi:hypothetical protein
MTISTIGVREHLPLKSILSQRHRRVYAFFVLQLILIVFFQKIKIPGLEGGPSVTFLTMWAGLFWLVPFARIDAGRAVLYALTVTVAFASQIFSGQDFSSASFLLFCFAYAPFMLVVRVSRDLYLRCLESFQWIMVIVGLIVIIEDGWQVLASWESFPNMNQLFPKAVLVEGYAYIQPLFYGSNYVKPNAFFFLEVSFLSQFTACALIVELLFFQRLWRMALYLMILFISFAGTGLLMVALIAPFLLLRLSRRLLWIGIIPGLVILTLAMSLGWYDQVERRFSEFNRSDSSSYMRFIEPGEKLAKFASDSSSLYTGLGAGAAPKDPNVVWWSVTKLVAEYGLSTAILFHLFFLGAIFVNAPSRILALTLTLMFSVMGSNLLGMPVVNLCFLLSVLLRPVGASERHSSGFIVKGL